MVQWLYSYEDIRPAPYCSVPVPTEVFVFGEDLYPHVRARSRVELVRHKSDSTVVALNLRSSRFYMLSSFVSVVFNFRVNDSLCNSQKILIRTGNLLC